MFNLYSHQLSSFRSKDGDQINAQTHPQIQFMDQGGRVALIFKNAKATDGGKYMCTATNPAGVATSSAQFVVRRMFNTREYTR